MILRYALQMQEEQHASALPLQVYAPPQPEEEYNRLTHKQYRKAGRCLQGQLYPLAVCGLPAKGVHGAPNYVITVTARGKK